MFQVPQHIMSVVRELDAAGYQAVIVGGAVRDSLLNRPVHDWDVATAATPDEMKAVFGARVHVGSQRQQEHGTLLIGVEGGVVELTTFRLDVETDGRHAQVRYTRSLVEDLQRRDLTINALAYDPIRNCLYGPGPDGSPLEAMRDLTYRIIRFVGDGLQRIREDRLRAARAVRIGMQISGQLLPETRQAVTQAIALNMLPGNLSGSRIAEELSKTLALPNVGQALRLWRDTGLLMALLPPVGVLTSQSQNIHHEADVLEHTIQAVESAEARPGVDLLTLRWTLLLHDIGKPETAEYRSEAYGYTFIGHEHAGAVLASGLVEWLCLPKEMQTRIAFGVAEHMAVPNQGATAKSIRAWARRVGYDNVEFLLAVRAADRMRRADTGAGPTEIAEHSIHAALVVQPVKELPIDGFDVMQRFGLKPGREVGQLLKQAADLYDDNPLLESGELLNRLAQIGATACQP